MIYRGLSSLKSQTLRLTPNKALVKCPITTDQEAFAASLAFVSQRVQVCHKEYRSYYVTDSSHSFLSLKKQVHCLNFDSIM